tara:strand:- start:8630 stop:10732 length:2103 start_codon:yes stop_codon:yes gene_type:complete
MKNDRMTESELCTIADYMVKNSITESGTFNGDNERYLQYYKGEPFGNEVQGRSTVVSTDTRDMVESDMPSLARVFLGAGDPVEFKPISKKKEALEEARDKQLVVSHIIRSIRNSFRTQHDWLKASEIQNISSLEYGVEEIKKPKYKTYSDITEQELVSIISDIEDDPDVEKVDIIEQDSEDGEGIINLVKLRIIVTKNEYFMRCVPVEDMIISKNAQNKEDAQVIGKRFTKTRGDLLAEGFSRKVVDSLASTNTDDNGRNSLKAIRYADQGGEDFSGESYGQWASEEVEGIDVYALIDFDGDGIAERRHVIKCGKVVLENEPFDHVPYAIFSSMLMPNNLIGIPRAELTEQYQKINSALWRQTLDNMYASNQPRWAYNDNVDIDSLLDHQFGGAVYVEGQPAASLQVMETPYTGDKSLQVISFMEGKKQSSTGAPIANQGLEADQLHKETATRFKGMDDANKSKLELVARVVAEVGYRDLWEGFAWFASQYQDTELEVRVLGREMTVDPMSWKYDHYICAKVGTGSGDSEKQIQNLSALYSVQTQLQQAQSPMVDNTKLFNTLSEMATALGKDSVSEFFNNPDEPAQIVEAERDTLRTMVGQLQQQMQNPLAEAEQVKGQFQMQMKQMEQKYDAQLDMMKMEQKYKEDVSGALQTRDKQLRELQYKYDDMMIKNRQYYDKLEVENNVDIKGEGTNDDPRR